MGTIRKKQRHYSMLFTEKGRAAKIGKWQFIEKHYEMLGKWNPTRERLGSWKIGVKPWLL